MPSLLACMCLQKQKDKKYNIHNPYMDLNNFYSYNTPILLEIFGHTAISLMVSKIHAHLSMTLLLHIKSCVPVLLQFYMEMCK